MIIGMGEIGKAIKGITGDTQSYDAKDGDKLIFDVQPQVLHICFPYGNNFVELVEWYRTAIKPEHTVIWSTVPIGTTKRIKGAVHSPVEGKHPDLELSIRYMERWIGYNDKEEGLFFNGYFRDLGLRTRMVENSDCTEALKLLSTTEYGINIEFARYKKRVADEIGMDYELTKEFNREYNSLYNNLGMAKRFQKFVLDAPKGSKGGHCVTPNARLLHDQFPSELTKIVGEL